MLGGIVLLVFGAMLTLGAWQHWRLRKMDTVSVLEAAISRVTGEEPLGRTRLDRLLTYFHAILGFILGPILIAAGLAVVFA